MLEVEEVDKAVTPQHLVGKVRGPRLGKNWTEKEMSLSYFEIFKLKSDRSSPKRTSKILSSLE